MRTIKKIHTAEYRPIADLMTYSPLPSRTLQQIDPFIFLNHHGFQTYPPNNRGLPFGPHPHRGMETVTFIIEGDIMHKDSGGHESIIKAGGIQWMTAGRGLIHAEVSSAEFKKMGGDLEILQLWLNLPARLKMTPPSYVGLQKEQIPQIKISPQISMALIAGQYNNKKGAVEALTDVFMSTVALQKAAEWSWSIAAERNVFLYVVRGKAVVNGSEVSFRHLIEFDNDADILSIQALEDTLLILGHAEPFNEPMVAQGPFVMNTEEEIYEAYDDYQRGKFGRWNH